MKCCNVRILSYISAGLQLVAFTLFAALVITLLCIGDKKEYLDVLGGETTAVIAMAISLTWIPLFIILLIGIKKESVKLVSTFLYAAHTILVIGVVYLIYDTISRFVNKEKVSEILLNLFFEIIAIALEILFTIPMEILNKRLKAASPDGESITEKECCHGVNKAIQKAD